MAEGREREGQRGTVDQREFVSATYGMGIENTEVVGERGKGELRWVQLLREGDESEWY